jgi:metal-responsive CopG/Arc/MetJ family transcriptional regulator
MSTPQAVISISLPRQTLQRVDSIAREQDRSRSKLIAIALRSWLTSYRSPRARQQETT